LMDKSIGEAKMGSAHDGVMTAPLRPPRVAIIGAGMSGICMAIALRRAGVAGVTIYEKAQGVGGPGATTPIPV
jgi:cation diffusion facilitator CzcD-associated flavoprotein CzcO